MTFEEAVHRFNANVSYSGLLHAVTAEVIHKHNKYLCRQTVCKCFMTLIFLHFDGICILFCMLKYLDTLNSCHRTEPEIVNSALDDIATHTIFSILNLAFDKTLH